MKDRLSILIFSMLLLVAVSYVQVFQKLMVDNRFSIEVINVANDDAEENTQKTSEENARETDLDEDPFRLVEMMIMTIGNSRGNSKIEDYPFGQLGYFPEIVSPPPQA